MIEISVNAQLPAAGEGLGLGQPPDFPDDFADQELVGRTSAPARGRALVPTARACPGDDDRARPSAAFLAQLIATALKAPQTRARGRAEPSAASAAYATAAARGASAGRMLRCSM